MKVLPSQNQSEQEDGQEPQGADQNSTQVHIYNGDTEEPIRNEDIRVVKQR